MITAPVSSPPTCDPVICTVDNYKELLIDSGYYTEADVA